ncbi:hypothetical protein [Vibrio nigripulchritudo]|uniref:hypothetical protein n=1 Tax=Vibrio nigripulchritudo TaxID=28173 RepID=UPI00190B07DA|nr:hypothetical protein [Vibrio nigripulchritudo]
MHQFQKNLSFLLRAFKIETSDLALILGVRTASIDKALAGHCSEALQKRLSAELGFQIDSDWSSDDKEVLLKEKERFMSVSEQTKTNLLRLLEQTFNGDLVAFSSYTRCSQDGLKKFIESGHDPYLLKKLGHCFSVDLDKRQNKGFAQKIRGDILQKSDSGLFLYFLMNSLQLHTEVARYANQSEQNTISIKLLSDRIKLALSLIPSTAPKKSNQPCVFKNINMVLVEFFYSNPVLLAQFLGSRKDLVLNALLNTHSDKRKISQRFVKVWHDKFNSRVDKPLSSEDLEEIQCKSLEFLLPKVEMKSTEPGLLYLGVSINDSIETLSATFHSYLAMEGTSLQKLWNFVEEIDHAAHKKR